MHHYVLRLKTLNFLRCVNWKCEDCGIGKLKTDILARPDVQKEPQSKTHWQSWDLVRFGEHSRKVKVAHSGTVGDLFDLLFTESEFIASHLQNASWQRKQYQLIQNNPPVRTVVSCSDFAENPTFIKWNPQVLIGTILS